MTDTTDSTGTVLQSPEIRLEDVRKEWQANRCYGRGRETAAGRGYNTELLANAVLDPETLFLAFSQERWYDAFVTQEEERYCKVECKSCVNRYPSGAYGRFRIWRDHHRSLVEVANNQMDNTLYLYFFLVYTVEDAVEKEIGKAVAPVTIVDDILDGWTSREHVTMGTRDVRDISWRELLDRLDVSCSRFKAQDAIEIR